MGTPQKYQPIHSILVQEKYTACLKGGNCSPGLDVDMVARELADQGKFDIIDGEVLLSDRAFEDWLFQNQHRYN